MTGADTVIFVDSDFNPQNDLQAVARAHRLGQTRCVSSPPLFLITLLLSPVKVIRLVCKDTAEEVILHRAANKLRLTSAIIEGGQFSTIAGCNSSEELRAILKFGLERLLKSDKG